MENTYKDKKILVVGAARSGVAAARLLKGLGACVTLADMKKAEAIQSIADEMTAIGVKLILGRNADKETILNQDLIISSPGIPLSMETFRIADENGIPIMGEMELAFTLCPCPIAAITGTNGKTTTTSLTGEIIKLHNNDTHVVGNIGYPFTECVSDLTENSYVVLEASSFQLERITVFKPAVSAMLNITPDHIERHGSIEEYIRCKMSVFQNQEAGSYLVLNKDDEALRAVQTNRAKVIYFSRREELSEGAYLRGDELRLALGGNDEKLVNIGDLRILGMHNVENALAAALVSACAGVPIEMIRKGLAEFKGVEHRIEFVRELDGVKYYNDSKATNPDAAIKALEAMKGDTVLIAGGDYKKSSYDEFTALFKNNVSFVIALGLTKEEIITSAINNGYDSYCFAENYDEAVKIAKEKAVRGGNVLLSPACASYDMFNNYEERGKYFKHLVESLG